MGIKNTLQKPKNTLKPGMIFLTSNYRAVLILKITKITFFKIGIKNTLQKRKNTLKQGMIFLTSNYRAALILKLQR